MPSKKRKWTRNSSLVNAIRLKQDFPTLDVPDYGDNESNGYNRARRERIQLTKFYYPEGILNGKSIEDMHGSQLYSVCKRLIETASGIVGEFGEVPYKDPEEFAPLKSIADFRDKLYKLKEMLQRSVGRRNILEVRKILGEAKDLDERIAIQLEGCEIRDCVREDYTKEYEGWREFFKDIYSGL